MSYTIKRDLMIAFVQNDQLQCASIKVKASGNEDVFIYNALGGLQALLNTKIFTQKPTDVDLLPTLEYRQAAHCLYSDTGILKRLENIFSKDGVTIKLVDKQKDSVLSVASLFWIDRKDMVACQVLETDLEKHDKKTLIVTEDLDVDYVNSPVVIPYDADAQCVHDTYLCERVYTLHGWNETVTCAVGK
ncbi:hypothetical protein pEaSNUABM22_00049 [Erwinia phage pEa_SNUABM_22]|uniref:Uncharacterized protein n=1 Tax=Erwinia phage pEa_SNUABM_22 TaxID=2869549 RepID=A0AAE8XQY4_9CAUD|nr:hypothetical protein MPK63_gp049 [Erwinia phage pEa_SNUABM_22]QZE58952.1 hypothetical protein pEaSNUABM18_00049 [Erwinia phage pEa_SNUABM_18]UAW96537.1 hypothetical protein pEaSNUABM22_00049 [Erwinia phage pEa_SNUABM_22]